MTSGFEISPRRAALVAGLGYLLTPTPFAEFYVWPRLVDTEDADRTFRAVASHPSLLAVGVLCYLVSYGFDVVIAWALYYLLKPVSAPLSMLAAWFRLLRHCLRPPTTRKATRPHTLFHVRLTR